MREEGGAIRIGLGMGDGAIEFEKWMRIGNYRLSFEIA